MTNEPFSYEEFEETREQLISAINKSLTYKDKAFLLAFTKGKPTWDNVDYSMFPAIQWKLFNIQKLRTNNPSKHQEQIELLQELFV